jgi:hypothetical protein
MGQDVREPVDDRVYVIDECLQEWENCGAATPLVQAYLRNGIAIHLHLFGYVGRNRVERPPKNLCVSFYRDPRRLHAKPVFARKIRAGNGCYSFVYNMKVSVLVDVVEFVQMPKRLSCPIEIVVPSVVRLEELDPEPFPFPEPLDPSPIQGHVSSRLSGGRGIEDREGGLLLGLGGDSALVVPDMELVDEVVEGRAEVEQAIPDVERPRDGIDGLDVAEVKAIFEAPSVDLRGDRIGVRGSFGCQGVHEAPGVIPLLLHRQKASGHALPSHHDHLGTSPLIENDLRRRWAERESESESE